MKKFFVYHEYGSCHDGSHSAALDSFDTYEEACALANDLRRNMVLSGEPHNYPVIIEGQEIPNSLGIDAAEEMSLSDL